MMAGEARADEAAALALVDGALAELAAHGGFARLDEAEALLDRPLPQPVLARLANLVAHCRFRMDDQMAALAACRRWRDAAPGDSAAVQGLLSVLLRLRRWDEAIVEAEAAARVAPDDIAVHTTLAHALGELGRMDEARVAGTRALVLEDRVAGPHGRDLSRLPRPRFDPAARARNVIAFSLFGTAPHYLEGALRNVALAAAVYPEWTCRIYVDGDVPGETVRRLGELGGDVRVVAGLPAARFGTFWRFLVAEDPGVDRFLVRDCDSCVNLRERAAVIEWTASDRHVHVMRDWHTHAELMLAGMWGGVGGLFPAMGREMIDFATTAPLERAADQMFLRMRVWPSARTSVLAHDRCFSFGEARPFPAAGDIAGLNVGMGVTAPALR